MTSYTLQLTLGTRTWTAQEMATLSYQLGQSGQTWQKTDGIVVRRLHDRGRLLCMQTDNYNPGTRLHELYDFDYDESQPFSIRLSLKGLSQWVDLGQALQDQGFLGISPPTTLADVHMLTYLDTLPLRASKWLAVDESQTHLLQLVKRTVNKTFKQLFEDNRSETFIRRVVNRILRSTHILATFETHIHRAVHKHVRNVRTHTEGDTVQLHQTRNHITNNYQAGITVAYGSSSFPANIVELAGLYAEDLGSQRIRLGPTALKPLLVVSQASPYTVEAQAGQTLTVPSATATDPLTGNSLSATANPATVSLGALATHTVTYTCQTSAGDLSSAILSIVVQDSSSPVVVLLGSSTVNLIVGDTYGSAEDAGATASDNLDGVLSVVTTGLPADTSVASTKTVTYTATDSQNLSASITRSLVVSPPYLFHDSTLYTTPTLLSSGLGTSLTSEVDQMSRGSNYGYEISFEFKQGTDTTGVVLSILDSSVPTGSTVTFYEAPTQPMTAAVVFRMTGTDMKVRWPLSHPGWIGSRYFEDRAGTATIPSGGAFNTYTLRVWDASSTMWGTYRNGTTAQYPKGFPSGSTYRIFVGQTSSWDGYALMGLPVNGALLSATYQSGNHISTGGAQIKNVTISALDATANHTVP